MSIAAPETFTPGSSRLVCSARHEVSSSSGPASTSTCCHPYHRFVRTPRHRLHRHPTTPHRPRSAKSPRPSSRSHLLDHCFCATCQRRRWSAPPRPLQLRYRRGEPSSRSKVLRPPQPAELAQQGPTPARSPPPRHTRHRQPPHQQHRRPTPRRTSSTLHHPAAAHKHRPHRRLQRAPL